MKELFYGTLAPPLRHYKTWKIRNEKDAWNTCKFVSLLRMPLAHEFLRWKGPLNGHPPTLWTEHHINISGITSAATDNTCMSQYSNVTLHVNISSGHILQLLLNLRSDKIKAVLACMHFVKSTLFNTSLNWLLLVFIHIIILNKY